MMAVGPVLAAMTRDVMHELAHAAAALNIEQMEQGRNRLKAAYIALATLRVQVDKAIGPKKLPRKGRR